MTGIFLSKEERIRFVSWLEQEVVTTQELIDQMEKTYPSGIELLIIKKWKAEMHAQQIVAAKLRSQEVG